MVDFLVELNKAVTESWVQLERTMINSMAQRSIDLLLVRRRAIMDSLEFQAIKESTSHYLQLCIMSRNNYKN